MGARHTALTALIACRKAGAWADSVLDAHIRRDGLDSRDAALATRLCCGVLQNRALLDFYLSAFSARRLSDLQPVVLDILRLGAYQILFSDRIPASAAVNEAVEQARKSANGKAAGYVNGVLRALCRGPLPEPSENSPDYLSTKYSHPAPLVELLRENIPAEALEPMLRADNCIPDAALQVNTCKTTASDLLAQLSGAHEHPWMPDCITMQGMGSPERLPAFGQGLFWVQDPAARLAVFAMELRPGMRVLDVCAAPGGKTFAAAAAMHGEGEILACDIHESRLRRITQAAGRLGFDCIRTLLCDATLPLNEADGSFDAVLIDAPCSGLGVIRKKPDIRYKDIRSLAGLPAIQASILESRCRAVKKGGILLYATCTVLQSENEKQIAAFLSRHGEFEAQSFSIPGAGRVDGGMITLYPGGTLDTDGFFICRLRRTS